MRALVTGGTGFLGSRLARRLLTEGWIVTAVGRDGAKGAALARSGAVFASADLRDAEGITRLCAGQDVVFHCGGLSAAWGSYEAFYDHNTRGTENVVAGCLRHGVARLVHVSTPSVCFGLQHRLHVSEQEPLPARPASAYAATKLLAELAVKRGCGAGLSAVTIRPRAIFGPGDPSLVPKLLAANGGRGIPMIDDGRALIDLTFVDNVVDALLLCARHGRSGTVYHITNGEPMPFRLAVDKLFGKLGVPVKTKRLMFPAAYAAAWAMELTARLFPGAGEPQLTRATAGMIGRSQTLDIRAARTELGYSPLIGVEEGMDAYASWWKAEQTDKR